MLYEVENEKACKKINNLRHYNIKWKGFKNISWEPENNLPDELIREYHVQKLWKEKEKKKQKNKEKQKKKTENNNKNKEGKGRNVEIKR